jgi:hypothetical protein
LWLAAAVFLGAVVPFTFIVFQPVNEILLQGGDVSPAELTSLLIRWGQLHWARTVASGLAFVTCLVAIVRRRA